MLQPDRRHLYIEGLKPPVGYRLDEAIATTYSLELDSLLAVPVSLALPGLDARRIAKESPVALLEAIRRVSSKLTVFCNVATIHPPVGDHVLYGLLEPIIAEVRAPLRGCLHTKLWVLRFVDETEAAPPILRLLVLSRNLTSDRSWDVTLQLDSQLGRIRAGNRPVADFLLALSEHTVKPSTTDVLERAQRLAENVRRAEWEYPSGVDEIAFHLLGLSNKPWRPMASDRLVVVSPFVQANVLQSLAETSREAIALVSRPDELDRVSSAELSDFKRLLVLHDNTELENGEEPPAGLCGLHAKLYVAKHGWDTRLYLGSANATAAGIGTKGSQVRNLELLVELVGKTSKLGGVDTLLGDTGLGPLLIDHKLPETPLVEDASTKALELEVDRFAYDLAGALELHFTTEQQDVLRPELRLVAKDLSWPRGLQSATAWLVTTNASGASSIVGLARDGAVNLASCAVTSATGLVAFELMAGPGPVRKVFASNLKVTGMPEDRDAQIVRLVVNNRDRFIQYLLSLLTGLDSELLELRLPAAGEGATTSSWLAGTPGLLEQLLRARSRAPERIEEARALVDTLNGTEQGRAILTDEFMALWNNVTVNE